MKVQYSYLTQQFGPDSAITEDILADIRQLAYSGDFTLGKPVRQLEEAWAEVCGVDHAIGVGNGTDALFLIMEGLDAIYDCFLEKVATVPNTFIATAGAIKAGSRNLHFLDVQADYLMRREFKEGDMLEGILLPVWWGGDMFDTVDFGGLKDILVVEDACQAIGARVNGKPAGSLGIAAAFSLHPLKNINVWGDGGMITTNNTALAEEIRLLRNHGLQGRDICVTPGYNSRLDSIQAIVALHGLKHLEEVNGKRRENAARYDEGLKGVSGVVIPPRDPDVEHAYHLYQIQVDSRKGLQRKLDINEIETKVHYPIPLHRQRAFRDATHSGLPVAEAQAERILSLPIHQYLKDDQIDFVIQSIREFYDD